MCYGFNPGAIITGLCTEDERVWRSTEWGNGYQGPMFEGNLPEAASHADGICLDSTVWLDNQLLLQEGNVVHPEFVEIARAIGNETMVSWEPSITLCPVSAQERGGNSLRRIIDF